MRRWISGLVSVQVLLVMVVAWAGSPVAVITEVKGHVYIKRAGKSSWQGAKVNMPLYVGDTLKTGSNSKVVVWTPTGRAQTLGPNKVVTLNPVKNSRDSLWSEVWGSFVRRMKANFSEENFATVAAARTQFHSFDKNQLVLLSPRNTKILESRPTFVWTKVENAKGYRVTVGFFDEGKRVWETTVNQTSLRYPDDAPEFKPEKVYIWQVEAIGVPGAVESAWFVVLHPAEVRDVKFSLQQLRSKAPDFLAYSLIAASFLESLGCYVEAISILSIAIKQSPQQPEPRFLLASLYETVGLPNLAEQMRAEAKGWIASARSLGWQVAATR
ncbi:MAG: hypothetical protein ACUVTP_10525 [Candidatus Fervidibacter sp.]|uniref:hypothetical protein n=1 Tax=Candidatus Fervidibacter sp. TaxID=3100871 RepID=UPI00404AFCF9